MPVSSSASGRFGVSTVARLINRVRSTPRAVASSREWPPLATITGSTTSGTPGMRASRTSHTVSITGAECSIPVLTQSTPRSPMTSSNCWRRNAVGTSWTPNTPSVFCAVSAVTAVIA